MAKKEKNPSNSSNEQDPASNEGAGSDSDEVTDPENISGEVSEEKVRTDNNPDVTSKKDKESDPIPVDMVKVQVTKRVECAIGKKFYTFVLGKNYIVSKTVHRVLVDRGIVKPTY